MDNILNKFSPQTFLRQFFCGFVFFVPLWLFASERLDNLLGGSSWQIPQCLALAILACIIGTIIYHVEKNLYSYGMQALLELREESKQMRIISFVIAVVVIGAIGCFFFYKFAWWSICFLIVPIILMSLIIRMRKAIPQRTQIAWAIEGGCKNVPCMNKNQDRSMDDEARKAIAGKVATWSDFIHCAQSCCFAWLAGCFMVTHGSLPSDNSMECSIGIAIAILVLEALFDWHRYRHVIAMTKGEYTKAPDKKQLTILKKNPPKKPASPSELTNP